MTTPDVVIIGAPRSGTNMLRDVLTTLPGHTTWPCDEINLIWRHGNRDAHSDELEARHARPEVRRYLRRQFDRVRGGAQTVVEKTCANSLRVEFVHRALPDARLVLITRDGFDAAASAMSRWHAPLDWGYTAAKARWVPPSDLPHYGVGFVRDRLRKRAAARSGSTPSSAGWWGPRPHDWRQLSSAHPLDEICMIQWHRCVEASRRDLARLPAAQVHHVTYESFVREPATELRRLLDFLGTPERYDAEAVAAVSAASIGKGRAGFSAADRSRLGALAATSLDALGHAR